MFALGISDFSVGEGVYPASLLVRLARSLGYRDLVAWDPGLHGWARLREAQEAPQEARRLLGQPPDPELEAFRLHVGARFTWRGHALGALPVSHGGYAALNRRLTAQAFEAAPELRPPGLGDPGLGDPALGDPGPPEGCLLLAETRAGLDALRREGFEAALLAHPRRASEAREALAAGLRVVAPQALRFRTAEGFELHRLKRAIATQDTVPRVEPLWDPRDGAVARSDWEARFPACDPRVQRATAEMLERVRGWRLPWGERWVIGRPLGLEAADLDALLEARVREGLRRPDRPVAGDAEARLRQELALIREKQFASYFLLIQDLLAAAQPEAGICGRGSGAASLVAYALGLTNVDPVGTGLLFERFLTPQRTDPPDMDLDFAWDERDRVIAKAFERYGRDRVAMVANHAFFKTRGALRAVAQAHGRPEAELKQLSDRSRGWEGGLAGLPEDHPWRPLLAWAARLKGHFHQLSVHPGGIVIAPGPLWKHAPFQPAPAKEGVAITQWDKEGVEGYGLVKLDLLGNRSLAVIRDACAVLGSRVPPDFAAAARKDAPTQHLLAQGDSMGVFYVESPAMRQLQQRVHRGDFETLVIHSSLIRPAAWRWVNRYVARVRGEEAWAPPDPVFEDLLSESFGVLIYQEDVLKVCVALAGWSYDEAERLRKLLGKADCNEKLPLFEARFRSGAAAKGVRPEVVDEAWDMIRTFQGYSFCKPHSASYAQVSFQSAWLKAHHPAAFFASVITNQGGFYPAIAYLGDARRHRMVVRGPDANASAWAFTAEGEQAVRVGLMQVQGARAEEVQALLEDRERNGPFAGLDDLLARVGLSLPTVEALCAAGAFDRWAPDGDRTRLLWSRLGGVPPGVRPRPTDPFDRADLEMETLGLTLELHPAALARHRRGGGTDRLANAAQPGRRLRCWALVVAEKVVGTRTGEAMQFVTLEDETGLAEAVAFPDAFRRRRRPCRVGDVLNIQGRSTRQDNLAVLELG